MGKETSKAVVIPQKYLSDEMFLSTFGPSEGDGKWNCQANMATVSSLQEWKVKDLYLGNENITQGPTAGRLSSRISSMSGLLASPI
jgi:hypothetical protein